MSPESQRHRITAAAAATAAPGCTGAVGGYRYSYQPDPAPEVLSVARRRPPSRPRWHGWAMILRLAVHTV
jgi:hypothetical protein